MLSNHLSGIADKVSYGYGWIVCGSGESFAMGDLNIDLPYIRHGGSTGVYNSILTNINDGRYIVTLLSNVGDQARETEIAREIVKQLLENNDED